MKESTREKSLMSVVSVISVSVHQEVEGNMRDPCTLEKNLMIVSSVASVLAAHES